MLDFAADLEIVADTLGIETFHVIGLSGGGPYTLAAGAAMPDRVLGLNRVVQPAGDKRIIGRPEFRAMFLDDLLNGTRKQVTAPIWDLLLFTRDWGFQLADVKQPVRWWHGDGDHIVPRAHGGHCLLQEGCPSVPGAHWSHAGPLAAARAAGAP